ncbi:MAG: acetyl-CoA decarbonylase/synthase complex subunit delta, partial [Chloroflexi bacterium]|nr:acetyl-CoA decarbonylase/synthase complex subunit delta [Chloroflexota bacterium]
KKRAIYWETLTATPLIHAGADVIVLRHPESLKTVKGMISALMSNAS